MLERLRGYEQKYNMSLDLEEEYLDIYYRRGKTGAGIWYWLQVFFVLIYFFFLSFQPIIVQTMRYIILAYQYRET